MPVTPYHFGAGVALKAVMPRQFSSTSFVLAQLIIDLEPLYYLTLREYPWHRFMHTLAGASLVVLLTILFAKPFRLAVQGIGRWVDSSQATFPPTNWIAVIIGAVLGAYSHIALDSIMHDDVFPLAPFSQHSPWFRALAIDDLENCLLVAGTLGLIGITVRFWDKLGLAAKI